MYHDDFNLGVHACARRLYRALDYTQVWCRLFLEIPCNEAIKERPARKFVRNCRQSTWYDETSRKQNWKNLVQTRWSTSRKRMWCSEWRSWHLTRWLMAASIALVDPLPRFEGYVFIFILKTHVFCASVNPCLDNLGKLSFYLPR